MWEAFALALGIRAIEVGARERAAQPVVPEPEFQPFHLPSRRGGERGAVAGGSPTGEVQVTGITRRPRTLVELGVPGPLAAELEGALRSMGMVDGDRIVGFSYRTPDGVQYPLRAAKPVGARDRAA